MTDDLVREARGYGKNRTEEPTFARTGRTWGTPSKANPTPRRNCGHPPSAQNEDPRVRATRGAPKFILGLSVWATGRMSARGSSVGRILQVPEGFVASPTL